MLYGQKIVDFLESSRRQLKRLEEEERAISEIIRKLEGLIDIYEGTDRGENIMIKAESPPPASFIPNETSPLMTRESKPVGLVAESLLKEHGEAMSLEDLYQKMKDRKDIMPSNDLKNAIRVSLIRRRPRIVSERRGWFRFVENPEET